MAYKTILVAVDLSNESDKVIEKALALAGSDTARIWLSHVVEPVAAAYPIDAYAINMTKLQEEAMAIAAERLGNIASIDFSADGRRAYLGSLCGSSLFSIPTNSDGDSA